MEHRRLSQHQYRTQSLDTILDPGTTRNVTLMVYSADRLHSGKYELAVRRPSCPTDARFFDTEQGRCTATCEFASYPDTDSMRCRACGSHCLSCGAFGCRVCEMGYVPRGRDCSWPMHIIDL